MLPSSKGSLIAGGYSPKQASWILISCFLGGVLGIQIISRIMHHFMPTHAVDCDHTHHDEPKEHSHGHDHGHDDREQADSPMRRRSSLPGHIFQDSSGRRHQSRQSSSYFANSGQETLYPTAESEATNDNSQRRASLHERVTNTLSQLTTGKTTCDSSGPCYGYSDPCGHECFKNVNARGGYKAPLRISIRQTFTRAATATTVQPGENTPLLKGVVDESRPRSHPIGQAPTRYYTVSSDFAQRPSNESSDTLDDDTNGNTTLHKVSTNETGSSHGPDVHHHHVPTNAFLSIGLQTSIAIALHKLPEGFITYATNHANPNLGFSVFLALFTHNITEGFAMALPLYLAINSRVKAMLISFVLGGLSQPIGAGVAAIWFKIAGQGSWAPSEGVYGGMFAVTAGIMASVALQLFSESLDLTHSRALCMLGAFAGMGVLGISSALTA